jgi:biotin carboxylase
MRQVHTWLKRLDARVSLMVDRERVKADFIEDHYRIIGVSPGATIEEWIEIALAIHRIDPIHAVCAFHEMQQDKAALIAQRLGLPFHLPETVESVRQKDKMRRKLRLANIDPTEGRRVKAASEIALFGKQHGYPLILKPVDGWASTGVSLIRNVDDIPAAIDWFGSSGAHTDMYVEQYIDGVELSVEALSEQGQHRIFCVTQKYKDSTHFVEQGHCVPMPLDQATQIEINDFVSQVLTTLGISDGASHTEIMLTEQGLRVVETHTRLGGDSIPDLFKLVSGIDVMELCARQALGEHVLAQLPPASHADKFAAIWYASPRAAGTLERIEGAKEAQNMPGVLDVQLLKEPGMTLGDTRDSFSRSAYAIGIGNTADEAIDRAKSAIQKFRFVVSCCG